MNFKKITLATAVVSVFACGSAMAASPASGTMTVDATLVAACEVSAASSIQLGNINALLSNTDKSASSGSTFQVACSDGSSPSIYSTGARSMVGSNGGSIPFTLSLVDGGTSMGVDLAGAETFTLAKDGALHDVPVWAGVAAADFGNQPIGVYTADVTVSVAY